jgi:hypothetical protein
MKNSYLARKFLPVGFLLGLFQGPQYYDFILTAPDNISQIGKGRLENGPENSDKVHITLYGKDFNGTGIMSGPPRSQQKDLRPDRAMMAPRSVPYAEHGFATVKANDGSPSRLTCEFYVRNEQVDGHCFDPGNTKIPSIPVHPSNDKEL